MTEYIQQLHEAGILIAAFWLAFCSLCYTLLQKRTAKVQNRLFIWLLLIIMINSACEVCTVFQTPYGENYLYARIMVELSMYFYFATHTMLCPLLFFYVLFASGVMIQRRSLGKSYHPITFVPYIFAEIIVLINPFTHWVWRFDDDFVYHRIGGIWYVYLCAGLYFLMAAFTMIARRKAIERSKRMALFIFFVVNVIGLLLQMLNGQLHTELFAQALALTGVMLTIENEDERMDLTTKVYNRGALLPDLNTYLRLRNPFSVICIRITNSDMLQRLLGVIDSDRLLQKVAEYLKTVHPSYYIYRPTMESFMLVILEKEDKVNELKEQIRKRFEESFEFQGSELILQATLMNVRIPGAFLTASDILLLCDGPLPARNTKSLLEGKDLDYLLRRAEVENALHRGLSEGGFEVYYQPIYRMQGMSIYSAEALLRLKDSKIGNIMPDEFIPIAEQNGLIDQLGDFVLEEVCIFLSSGIPTEMGLECISVNLSVLQCLQPDFVGRVLAITKKYEVDSRYINFEITESAAASDYDVLSDVLRELRRNGFLFSLDDYGIGYSNVRSIFSLDFDVIKIDKSILWEVQKESENGPSNGQIILENSVRMLREMQLKILVEGVETADQLELLEALKVDYLQGFYFSRPVSKNELLGILRVTELTRMEEQRARAASEAKSSFLANMSHEIRTPINAVLGMNEMILRESKNKRILDYAHNIEGAGRTLVSLINDILDFSKIESGSMEIVETEYDLSSVINDVVNMIQIKVKEKGLDFTIKVDPDLPDALYGDGMRFRQIMVNILNNAVKYTPHGSVTFELTGRLQEKDRLLLKAVVTDTGIGIKEEDLGKLFRKFQRFDMSQNQSIEGSGLGLAITYNLLQIMHGEIEARSTYGKGSTFTVMLPQKIMRRDAIGDFRRRYQMNVKEQAAYHESFRAPDARILVVDDTPVNHTVLKELLKKTKLLIDCAYSGKECIEMVQHNVYDLIFLDYRMPEMDGIETLHVMKALEDNLNRKTPVVALTANAVAGARENFLREGFDDYMIKPVESQRLEEMLIHYLPAEKVHLVSAADEELPEEDVAEERWLDKCKGLDTETGLKNCGSEDGYLSVLKIYYEGLQKKAEDIQKFFDAQDWENYTIQVHSLKSSSRVIGAMELGEEAAELEAAGNQKDLAKITQNTAPMLKRLRALGVVLSDIFEADAEDVIENTSESGQNVSQKPEISASQLKEAYEMMKDFAKLYDYDNMLYILDSLKEYQLDPRDRETVQEIRKNTEEFQWEQILNLLQKTGN